jgi:hypothetical protein
MVWRVRAVEETNADEPADGAPTLTEEAAQ